MNKNLRWKLLAVLAVIVVCAWAIYPPSQTVRLGLDLKGGVHLVLKVETDEALKLETQTAMEQIREDLVKNGAPAVAATALSVTDFQITGVPADHDAQLRTAAGLVESTFNRESGVGGTYTFRMKPNIANQLRQETVEQAIRTIERRVNELGVAEPIVARQGSLDQIIVQLPGVTDVARAKEIIRSTSLLELKLVEQGPASAKEQLMTGGVVPPDAEILPGTAGRGADAATPVFFLVRKVPVVSGRDLRTAKPSLDENNRPAVSFSLKPDGATKFGNFTAANINRNLAIVLDGRVESAPVIEGRISDDGRIAGNFTQQEASDLALKLRSGALPASLTYLEERTVGPSLGADSIRAGIVASGVGLALVVTLHARLLQAVGHQRDCRDDGEPARPAGADGLPARHHDAARHCRLHPDDRHGRGQQRAHLRTHQGRAARRQGRSRGHRRGLRPGLPHDSRHAHRVAHLRRLPLQLRHRADPGFATTLSIGLLTNVFTSVFVSRALFELALGNNRAAKLSI